MGQVRIFARNDRMRWRTPRVGCYVLNMTKRKSAVEVLFVLVACSLLSGCVNRLFYYPNAIEYRTPDSLGSPVTDVTFESLDGTRLHGWFAVASTSNALGTVVHFHGNAQNLTAHSGFVDWLPAAGYNVFMFDYRGYGASEGKPSRKGLYMDGVAALRFVRTLPGVDTNRMAIFGQSLGGATALAVAGRHPELAGQAVVIDSAFYSYRRIVRDKIAMIPVLSLFRVPLSWLVISDAYSPAPVLKNISPRPILYIHGTSDQVIPVHHAHLLYENSSEPKQLFIIENGTHTSAFQAHPSEATTVMLEFLEKAMAPAPVPLPGATGDAHSRPAKHLEL